MKKDDLETFKDELLPIIKLYGKIKEALILAENVGEGLRILVAPLNELRNALDHVMRAIDIFYFGTTDLAEALKELPKIKEHLLRAGYDGYELIALTLIDHIQQSNLKNYTPELISKIYPHYYEDENVVAKIKQALQEIRSNKKSENVEKWLPGNDFDKYLSNIDFLHQINENINNSILSLQKLKNDKEEFDRLTNEINAICDKHDVDILTKVIPDYTKNKTEFLRITQNQDITHLQRLSEIHELFFLNQDDLRKQKGKWWTKEIKKGVIVGILVGLLVGVLFVYIKREGPFKESQKLSPALQDNLQKAKPR
jgi:hypothetical protein